MYEQRAVIVNRHRAPYPYRLLARIFLVAVGLNFIWEMLQMRAYVEMADRPWRETLGACTVASFLDAVLSLTLYIVVAAAHRDLSWPFHGNANIYVLTAVISAITAIFVEIIAVSNDYWSYTKSMPTLPVFNVGAWPVLQLALLVPFSIWIAALWSKRSYRNSRTHGRVN